MFRLVWCPSLVREIPAATPYFIQGLLQELARKRPPAGWVMTSQLFLNPPRTGSSQPPSAFVVEIKLPFLNET
jgi:hypothetical protein